jgi:hypothetical protein
LAVDKMKGRGDEREHAHRHETDFKTMAKRNRLFGMWIGEQIGLNGDAASAYARDVVMADLEEPGEDDLFRKVRADLERYGKTISDADLRAKLEMCWRKAEKENQSA